MSSALDEARSQLVAAIGFWDFTSYFPSDYDATLKKEVLVVTEFPSDQLDNIEGVVNGQLTQPVISVIDLHAPFARDREGARLGNIVADLGGGHTRFGQVFLPSFQVDCWADLQTGGGEQAERLAGGVMDCLLINQNTLTSFRRLTTAGGRSMYVDAAQLWRVPVTVSGRIQLTWDV